MPLRVQDADVLAIIDTTINVHPFVEAASLLVDRYFPASSLSLAELREIERWWAAHLVAIRDPRFTQIRTEGDSMVFEGGRLGEGLRSTRYGQQVLVMDSTGVLAQVGTVRRASIFVD